MLPGFERPTGYEDDLAGPPEEGFWPRWGGGVALPAALVVYGCACILTRQGFLPGHYGGMHLVGPAAVAMGIACLFIAIFTHSHYFWGSCHPDSGIVAIGKTAGALGFLASFGYLIIRVGAYG